MDQLEVGWGSVDCLQGVGTAISCGDSPDCCLGMVFSVLLGECGIPFVDDPFSRSSSTSCWHLGIDLVVDYLKLLGVDHGCGERHKLLGGLTWLGGTWWLGVLDHASRMEFQDEEDQARGQGTE